MRKTNLEAAHVERHVCNFSVPLSHAHTHTFSGVEIRQHSCNVCTSSPKMYCIFSDTVLLYSVYSMGTPNWDDPRDFPILLLYSGIQQLLSNH